jgi:hypothetical protein
VGKLRGQWLNIRGFTAIRVLVARSRVVMKASRVLLGPDPSRDTNEVANENGTDGKGNAMKRKAPLRYDNAIGCVLLWAAVIRPDRRTAMKWLRLAMRERNLNAKLQ